MDVNAIPGVTNCNPVSGFILMEEAKAAPRPVPYSTGLLFLIPLWLLNLLGSCERSMFAAYDGRVAWIGQYFLTAIIVFGGIWLVNRLPVLPGGRLLLMLVGAVTWFFATSFLHSVIKENGLRDVYASERTQVQNWTGGDFPPGCVPEYDDDSFYGVFWHCQMSKEDLVSFFRTRLNGTREKPAWKAEVILNGDQTITRRFYRVDAAGQTTDEIYIESKHPGSYFTIDRIDE